MFEGVGDACAAAKKFTENSENHPCMYGACCLFTAAYFGAFDAIFPGYSPVAVAATSSNGMIQGGGKCAIQICACVMCSGVTLAGSASAAEGTVRTGLFAREYCCPSTGGNDSRAERLLNNSAPNANKMAR